MDANNPYTSPDAAVADRRAGYERDVPAEITSPIKHGWIAACVSGVLTLAATIISMINGPNEVFAGAWSLIDVALIAGFAFGIWRKSRVAATLMFLYFVASKILIMKATGRPDGLVLGLVFLIFYFRAMTATYRYHRFVKNWKRNPPPPRTRLSDDPLFAKPAPAEERTS